MMTRAFLFEKWSRAKASAYSLNGEEEGTYEKNTTADRGIVRRMGGCILFLWRGELFREPIVCWAFMSERPYVEDGPDEERYVEGQVLKSDRMACYAAFSIFMDWDKR